VLKPRSHRADRGGVKKDLKAQLHLKFVLPLLGVAAAGLAVMQLGLVDRLNAGDDTASAAQPGATQPATTDQTTGAAPATDATETTELPADAPEAPAKPTGMEQLAAKLEKHKVVVVLVYSPGGNVDSLATAEARLGAEDARAGFLALDASKERLIAELASTYDIRTTPTLLFVVHGPNLANKVVGWADRQTVAQLVVDARRAL
jgi:hypothetical protein